MVLTTFSFLPTEDKYLGSQEQETWIGWLPKELIQSLESQANPRESEGSRGETRWERMGGAWEGPPKKPGVSARGFYS